MNVEIELRPRNSQKREYINGIAVAVYQTVTTSACEEEQETTRKNKYVS